MEIQLWFTHPHIVPSLYDFLDYESFQHFRLFCSILKVSGAQNNIVWILKQYAF